jgi:hypothetical protein
MIFKPAPQPYSRRTVIRKCIIKQIIRHKADENGTFNAIHLVKRSKLDAQKKRLEYLLSLKK